MLPCAPADENKTNVIFSFYFYHLPNSVVSENCKIDYSFLEPIQLQPHAKPFVSLVDLKGTESAQRSNSESLNGSPVLYHEMTRFPSLPESNVINSTTEVAWYKK
jgi:hypothetical protein